ncbi:hypothetical protein B0H17DRAFT_911511, partial [Mycena rosella]
FPPALQKMEDVHRILTGSCNALLPERFVEDGCAVCGMLTPRAQLTVLDVFQGSLALLEADGVTRRERFSTGDPIEELDGPVLAHGCTQLCVTCET